MAERFKFNYMRKADDVWSWAKKLIDDLNKYPISGVVAHRDLTGLGADDHTQYLTIARGDARYYTETEIDVFSAAVSATLATKADKGLATASGLTMATARFLGRITAGVGAFEELTATQLTAQLNNFTAALKGLVPLSGGGTTNFLRADGTWAAPGGGGGGALAVEDEGVSLTTAATKFNFVGAGVAVTEPVTDQMLVTVKGNDWTVFSSTTIGAPVAQVDVIGLAGVTDIMIGIRLLAASASGFRVVQVSTDNGATFFTATGDYQAIATTGVETAASNIGFISTATTAARTGLVIIRAVNTIGPKYAFQGVNLSAVFVGSTAAINAIRISSIVGAGNLTGGTITVWAR